MLNIIFYNYHENGIQKYKTIKNPEELNVFPYFILDEISEYIEFYSRLYKVEFTTVTV